MVIVTEKDLSLDEAFKEAVGLIYIGINSKILQRCYRLVLTNDRIYKKPIPKDLIEEKKPFLLGNIVESKVN